MASKLWDKGRSIDAAMRHLGLTPMPTTLNPMVRAVAYACELIGWEWRKQQAEAMDAAADAYAATSQSEPKISQPTTA